MNILKITTILTLCLISISAQAQNAKAVKGTATDKTFGNTTQIYRGENATDTQILDQVSSDYGIGDVVRITDAPPPTPTAPVLTTKSVAIPEGSKPMPVPPKPRLDIPEYSEEDNIETPQPVAQKNTVNTEGVPTLNTTTTTNVPKQNVNTTKQKTATSSSNTKKSTTAKSSTGRTISSSKLTRGKRFLFFFKKKNRKTMKVGGSKKSKYECYKF
jgi:hypothetical protein